MIGILREGITRFSQRVRRKITGKTWADKATSPLSSLASREMCTGCGACWQVCPKGALSMEADDEGFLRPVLRASQCVQCHRCERACPVLHSVAEADSAPTTYAARTRNETLREVSSSGGLFTELARPILAQGGVVFGCVWDSNDPHKGVILAKAETEEALSPMRGSKYLQADVRETYREAKAALEAGRPVLFTGTPCQIAGLQGFLRKPYAHLLAVEIICHGAPSRKIWQAYLRTLKKRVTTVNFRDKAHGGSWSHYRFSLSFAHGQVEHFSTEENLYYRVFLDNYSLRPSCYACAFRSGKSCADLTIADLWGADEMVPMWNDERGLSLLVVHTEKGAQSVPSTLQSCPVDATVAFAHNRSYLRAVKKPGKRDWFMRHVAFGGFEHAFLYASTWDKKSRKRYYRDILCGRP